MVSVTEEDIANLARSYGVPEELALAVYRQESASGRVTKDSPRGAKGGFQVVPATFKDMDVGDNINDPYQNAEAGIKYLAQGYRATGGDIEATAKYYHAGPGFQRKLAQNPDLNDGMIRTVDYAKQVAAKVKGVPMDADRQVAQTQVTNAPSGNAAPSAGGDPLESLLSQAKELTAGLLETSSDLSSKIKDNLEKQTDSIKRQGELEATVSLATFQQQQQKASDTAARLSRLGINDSDMDSIVARISTELVDDYKQSQELRKSIRERQNAGVGGLFNILDPVGSIVGGIQLQQDIREHNRLIGDIDSKRTFVDKQTQLASNVAAVNAGKYTSVTAQGAQAAADLIREKAEKSALDIEDKMLKVDFDTQVRALTMLNHEVGLESQLENAKASREARKTAEEMKQDAFAKKKLEDDRVRAAGRILGLDITSTTELAKQPADIKNAVERVLASNAANGGQIAASPLEAAQTVARGNLNAMSEGMKISSKVLISAARNARAAVDSDPIYASASKQQREEAINKKMTENIRAAMANPTKSMIPGAEGKEANPFQIPEYGIMQADPTAQKLKLTQLLADTKKAMPTLSLDDKMIKELAYANVGKVYKDVSEAAKDISDYYKAGVTRNNNFYRLDALGLPPQTTYLVNGLNMLSYADILKSLLDKKREETAKASAVDFQNMMMFPEKKQP